MRWRVEPGQVIDGFTLQEHIGTGGMALLWIVTREDDPTPLVVAVARALAAAHPQGQVENDD